MRSFLRLSAVVLTLLATVFVSGDHYQAIASETGTASCRIVAEKNIVNAILNGDDIHVERLLGQFNSNTALIPSPEFYRALAIWHKGYQQRDQKLKTRGISGLVSAIKKLESGGISSSQNMNSILALGLAKSYVARALMENEQYVSGYKLGIEAIKQLTIFLQHTDPDTPGYDDAGFLTGLFEVYSHDLSNQYRWLISETGYRGDRIKGIELIEQSINGASVFANEASRTLLSEIWWQMPAVCRYREMIDQTGKLLARNADLSILRQGLLLKCGYPELALQANFGYQKHNFPAEIHQQLQKAEFRIYADLGQHITLLDTQTEPALKPFLDFAIANAMDVSGLHQQAVARYNTLVGDDKNPENIRTAAEVRIRFPYTAPEKIVIPQLNIQPPLCSKS